MGKGKAAKGLQIMLRLPHPLSCACTHMRMQARALAFRCLAALLLGPASTSQEAEAQVQAQAAAGAGNSYGTQGEFDIDSLIVDSLSQARDQGLLLGGEEEEAGAAAQLRALLGSAGAGAAGEPGGLGLGLGLGPITGQDLGQLLRKESSAPFLGFLVHSCLAASEAELLAGPKGSKAVRAAALRALGALTARVADPEALTFFLPGVASGLAKQLFVSGGLVGRGTWCSLVWVLETALLGEPTTCMMHLKHRFIGPCTDPDRPNSHLSTQPAPRPPLPQLLRARAVRLWWRL